VIQEERSIFWEVVVLVVVVLINEVGTQKETLKIEIKLKHHTG
jgi:hypothetical protein